MKNKKIISKLIIFVLVLAIIFGFIYFFKEIRIMIKGQTTSNKLTDLELAKKNLEAEKTRLQEIRDKTYFGRVSKEQYEKTKKLVSQTDIFFKNPNSNHPEIQIKTNNATLIAEINARRQQINEAMRLWAENNANSLETDQKLIAEIKTVLSIIKIYIDQLKSMVKRLSVTNSGLTTDQINSFVEITESSSQEIDQIIIVINETEIIINNSANNENEEVNTQINIIHEIEEEINQIEIGIIEIPIATSTSTSTPPIIVPVSPTATNTPTNLNTRRRPRIFNPEPLIIYQPNPAPYRDNGVDIITTSNSSPLQDW